MRTLLLLVTTVWAFAQAQTQTLEVSSQPTMPFPFAGITFTAPDSTTTVTADKVLKTGKPTVLAFWLTTCGPCQMELAAYAKQYADWQKEMDFQLFAISTDFRKNFRRIAVRAQEGGWPFPVWWDADRVFMNYLPGGLNGLPQVFLFDQKGKLVWHHRRYAPGQEALLLEQLRAVAVARK